MGTPTYILGMADTAQNKMGIDPKELGIQRNYLCWGTGAPVFREQKEEWKMPGGPRFLIMPGATEIGAWSYECRAQSGGIHANEAMFLVEIEDVETGEIIETPGRPGKMIITALDRMAQPCIRFDSKDIIEWAPDPCPCGSTFRLIRGGVQGRAR